MTCWVKFLSEIPIASSLEKIFLWSAVSKTFHSMVKAMTGRSPWFIPHIEQSVNNIDANLEEWFLQKPHW